MYYSIYLSIKAGLVQAFVCEVNLLKVCLFVGYRHITYCIEDIVGFDSLNTDTHSAIIGI